MKQKPVLKKFIAAFLLSALFSFISVAQTIEGDWYGKADLGGFELRLNVHVKAAGDSYISKWDSPDQGAMGIPSTTTSFKFPDFSFSFDEAGFKYTGQVNSDYTTITGVLTQNGRKFDIVFGRTPILPPKGSEADLKTRYDKQEVYITMRDGVKLFTSIYTPKNSTAKNPILLDRTPYDIEPGGKDRFNYFTLIWSRYLDDNYILVFQDVRGRFMSEGCFEDIRPVIPFRKNEKETDESTDTWDTVDWLVKNVQGSNGNVGIFGVSYPGFYSTMGAINAHPAMKAVSPQAPVTAWFIGDDFHHNGAFFLMDCFSFYSTNGHAFHKPTRQGFPGFNYPTPDNYEFYLSLGAIKNISPKYLGDSVKFWNDAFAHPDYDDFWKARDPRQYLKNVKPAVMTVGGWFDAEDLYGTLHTYQAIEKQNSPDTKNTLVMGPWSHGQWSGGNAKNLGNIYWGQDANAYYQKLEKAFFDFYLKGSGDGAFPEATIFVTGTNQWKSFTEWPPKNAEQKTLFLQQSGNANYSIPTLKVAYDEYVSDPMKPVPYTEDVHTYRTAEYMTDDQRFASRRPDVMVYQTDVLTEDITIAGPITADLFVSTTGTDADFVVKVIDVYPGDFEAPKDDDIKVPMGGYQMLVRGEIFRGKYRNSFEKPEPFVPGRVTEVRYELPDIAHTFKKGHRIMIQVQNSWFPLADRNPQKFVNIYKCNDSDFQKATMRIYHDSKYPSSIKFGILK